MMVVPSVQVGPTTTPFRQEAYTIRYRVSQHKTKRNSRGALVDRGANGGIIGSDAIVIHEHHKTVDVTGIDNHELNALRIVDATAKVETNRGPVIIILNQYAWYGRGRTIHSAGQIEHYKNIVHDRSMVVGGLQCIKTLDGYIIPLDIINGLPYMKMFANTKEELEKLPHVILTGGEPWDPRKLDMVLTEKEDWAQTLTDLNEGRRDSPFDEYGNYMKRQPLQATAAPIEPYNDEVEDPEAQEHEWNYEESYGVIEAFKADIRDASNLNQIFVTMGSEQDEQDEAKTDDGDGESQAVLETKKKSRIVKRKPVDYSAYRPYFLGVPTEKIRHTFERTTQNAINVLSGSHIINTLKSPFPGLNVPRREEPVAGDQIYANCKAIDTPGHTMMQFYAGRKSLVIDVYSMGSTNEFVNTLEDLIRKRGAPSLLITDGASVNKSQ